MAAVEHLEDAAGNRGLGSAPGFCKGGRLLGVRGESPQALAHAEPEPAVPTEPMKAPNGRRPRGRGAVGGSGCILDPRGPEPPGLRTYAIRSRPKGTAPGTTTQRHLREWPATRNSNPSAARWER